MARGLYARLLFCATTFFFTTTSPIYTNHLGIVDVMLRVRKMPEAGIGMLCQANTSCTSTDFPCPKVAVVLLRVSHYAPAYKRNAISRRNTRSCAGSVCQAPREHNTTNRLSPCHEHVACRAPVRTPPGFCGTSYVAPSRETPSNHCILHLHPPQPLPPPPPHFHTYVALCVMSSGEHCRARG